LVVFFLGQHIGEENPYARAYRTNMAPFGSKKKHGAIALETIYYYNRNLAARQIYREIRACTAPPLNLTQSHNYSTVYTYEEQTSVYIYEVTAPSRTQQGWVTTGSTNKFELAESY